MLTRCTLGMGIVAVAAALLAMAWAPPDAPKFDGPQRVTAMNGRVYEGTVEVDGDKYQIKLLKYSGTTQTLRKGEILKIEPMPKPANGWEADGSGGRGEAALLSEDEIRRLLDGIDFDIVALDESGDPEAALPVNEDSVGEMMRIAGTGADAKRYETAHFVFVYTSELRLAKGLASRLEAVYRWNVKVLKSLGMRYRQPDYKLEIYFFGKHDEYARYQNVLGQPDSVGTLGFYRPDLNRSAFFDMEAWPPIQQRLEQSKSTNVPYQERQRIRNENRRWVEWKNFEVVQHEAAHHIHFNIGVFSREAFVRGMRTGFGLPRWTVEGLATMFEAPETSAGASLGAINHQRVKEFRQFFGADGSGMPPLLDFMLDDRVFLSGGGRYYPLGWALSQYLWNKKREAYGTWLKALSELGDRDEFSTTERQQLVEDTFGKIDESWIKDFIKYIDTIQLRSSLLPPEIFGG